MKQLHQIVFKTLPVALCLITTVLYGQKQTKTYNETFKVDKDAVLDINTSHADIEFETWDKNEIQIQAVLEIEGISAEEAEKYFKSNALKIVGNSKTIEIRTQGETSWSSSYSFSGMDDFHIEIPEMPEIDFLIEIPPIPPLPSFPVMAPLPPLPPVAIQQFNFDYEAYEKDGEKYLKQWKKEFDKNFNEDFKEKMEAWSASMKERAEEMKQYQKEAMEAHQNAVKERQEAHRERQKTMQQRQQDKAKAQVEKQIMISKSAAAKGEAPSTFYWSSDGKESTIKVKKTIKINMPKTTKLKMNVRHGEVKLAENTRNMDATLSYARLLAATIDGENTNIVSSYSPVTVMNWNYGKLKTEYSDQVDLRKVRNLVLHATSSEVTIDQLGKSIVAQNDFGALRINALTKDCTTVDIKVQYGEVACKLPQTPFEISYVGTDSELRSPSKLKLSKTQHGRNISYTGTQSGMGTPAYITMNAKYSTVNLE